MGDKMESDSPEDKNSVFNQPRRRGVRQRSGFKVSGSKTGSECLIYKTDKFEVKGKDLSLAFSESTFKFVKLFSEDICIYGFGLYILSDKDLLVSASILVSNLNHKKGTLTVGHKQIVPKNIWTKIGFHLENNFPSVNDYFSSKINLNILCRDGDPIIEFFGLQFGPVDYYENKPKYKVNFFEKTDLYKPEIYYLPFRKIKISKARYIGYGFIIGKSCNRCARFLPIDTENELNPLGFSNHCKKRAPCSHAAFSRYSIENPKLIAELPQGMASKIVSLNGKDYFTTHFGFQLECRTCKKFEVNAPLNPLRNKAQHHEDGARRRAFERMIIELTKDDVVKNFRSSHKQEFQEYIWNNFGKTCFGCGKSLPKISNMDIDHTLPLSYLWPLNESATCLCKACNSLKHDLFPSEFAPYTKKKLKTLSQLTGISLPQIISKKRIVNPKVTQLLIKNSVWLFDDFLARKDYQKNKKGKMVADLIYKALQKVLVTENIDLIKIYFEETGKYPASITLSKN